MAFQFGKELTDDGVRRHAWGDWRKMYLKGGGYMDVTVGEIAALAGALMAIIALLGWIHQVASAPVKALNDTVAGLRETVIALNHTIDIINKDLEESQRDRARIRKQVAVQEECIRGQELKLQSHEDQLRSLWKGKDQ